ncbi:MAG: hypothetical protein ACYTDV_16070 [Planctomycetota bacterium]|jgi:hypothetical protein
MVLLAGIYYPEGYNLKEAVAESGGPWFMEAMFSMKIIAISFPEVYTLQGASTSENSSHEKIFSLQSTCHILRLR